MDRVVIEGYERVVWVKVADTIGKHASRSPRVHRPPGTFTGLADASRRSGRVHLRPTLWRFAVTYAVRSISPRNP
ncbi:hypothetical protein ACFUNF_21080 [Streptomyces sp. NPDC057291]|uniref:hypothetical protein n=1 Tax=Streptomyces sp. NPDC057291 TaxID=3346087 RepID=UPI00363E26C6